MVAFMHTGTRLTAGYRYTTLGDATRVWGELAVKLVVSNATFSSCVGNIRSALADLGPKPHLAHEFVNEFVVDHPALVAQVQQHSPIAVAMFVNLEAFPDSVLDRSVLIWLAESFLVVEECRPRHTGCL